MEESIYGHSETFVYRAAEWLQLVVETTGVVIIAWGVLWSMFSYGGQLFGRTGHNYLPLRLNLARYLVVALEFQLAADILGTAIAPDWDSIGKLAAIAIIRTVLNFFLNKEMQEEIRMQEDGTKEKIADSIKDSNKKVS